MVNLSGYIKIWICLISDREVFHTTPRLYQFVRLWVFLSPFVVIDLFSLEHETAAPCLAVCPRLEVEGVGGAGLQVLVHLGTPAEPGDTRH